MNHPENQNTPDQFSNNLYVLDSLNEMRHADLPSAFICSLMEHCQRYKGIRDLMQMWFEIQDPNERNEIIADLQDCLDDITDLPKRPEERPGFDFEELEEIRRDVIAFKQRLRDDVDRQGGISELARRTKIPGPSLSRFFNSGSMPRLTTLFKIAKALNLSESAIGFKWTT